MTISEQKNAYEMRKNGGYKNRKIIETLDG
jgi:hypothetical protein